MLKQIIHEPPVWSQGVHIMVDRHAAERIANAFLNSPHWNQTDDHFVIINDATIEKDYGWIFFYQSERYLQTSELRYSLSGNTPIVVERADGAVQVLPIHPIAEIAIAEYEAQRSG